MTNIFHRKATAAEQEACQSWDLWESGDAETFEYSYDKNVVFIVQQGKAVIYSPTDSPIEVNQGDYVAIQKGFEGRWDILESITNKYLYA